jgi:ribosome biogenesis GTPase / thiamine phosphate phosphatase
MSQSLKLLQGLVVASYGKRFEVELADVSSHETRRISCVTRGKKTDLACGDIVNIKLTDKAQGVVDSSQPRTSLLYRSSSLKSKILASNVTQIIIVLATQPSFYEALLNRCLVAAEAAQIKPLIVLNKCDLAEVDGAKHKLKLYQDLGYAVLHLSAKQDISTLKPYLKNHQSVLVGQSGMGKSTIINALLPNENVRTQVMSEALDSGKHTTTAAHLYHLDGLGFTEPSSLIDSPGLQEFGLNHLVNEEIELAFKEFRPYLGQCRFNNCKHTHEPDCAIINAVSVGTVSAVRLKFYQDLAKELMVN